MNDAPEQDPERWIGVDFARWTLPRVSPAWVPIAILALVSALTLASLRIDLIRTRYALADALAAEENLISEQRALIATRRGLRDPTALAARAREAGFRPAGAVITLVDPAPGPLAPVALPDVAAAPPANTPPVGVPAP